MLTVFFQMLALIPGTSRSGATIVGALLIGVSREVAAEFTFFLAIPAMCGASLLKLVKFGFHFTGKELGLLTLGCVVSFVLSIVAIKFLMNYIKKKRQFLRHESRGKAGGDRCGRRGGVYA